jgi:hypothetical protein
MRDATKNQVGSPNRDLFKRNHKNLHKDLWSLDIDFVFVEKYPQPDIIAILDYKANIGDDISFSEVIAYNAFIKRGIPVYIVIGEPDTGAFDIYRYNGGHHQRPDCRLEHKCSTKNWSEFEQWEQTIREHFKSLFLPIIN